MELQLIGVVVFWFACAFLTAYIADRTGDSAKQGFWVGLVLGPIAVVVALFGKGQTSAR